MVESDKDRMDRQEQQIDSLRREMQQWKDRALNAEAEVKERKCAMEFAERIRCNRAPYNAEFSGR